MLAENGIFQDLSIPVFPFVIFKGGGGGGGGGGGSGPPVPSLDPCMHPKFLATEVTLYYPGLGQNSYQFSQNGERGGSVVECLTRDRRAAGSSLTGVTALCP